MEWTGHKELSAGVTVSHHSQVGPAGGRKTSSGIPQILHYGAPCNYFITYHNVIIIEIKCTIHTVHLKHPEMTPHPYP